MQNSIALQQTGGATHQSVRLHYLDALRVLAVFMVFLFHAARPFLAIGDWDVVNAQTSMAATILFMTFLAPWGMAFFFMLAGAGAWFALRKRTARQFAGERVGRLLVPFLVGSALFTPLQTCMGWLFDLQAGAYEGPCWQYFWVERFNGWNPTLFEWLGHHLWFLAFLFANSLLLLPLFEWLKGELGRRSVSWLARLFEHRGGLLVFILPLVLIQLGLRPYSPDNLSWADFFYYLVFFLAGYLFYADERFLCAIRRDRWLVLAVGIMAVLGLMASVTLGGDTALSEPSRPWFYVAWAMISIDAWSSSLFMLFVGMRFLNVSTRWLQYGHETVLPFYVLHHPAVIITAFYVVQWQTGVTVKMLAVVAGAFVVSIGLYELAIKRFGPLRTMFGMKAGQLHTAQISAG